MKLNRKKLFTLEVWKVGLITLLFAITSGGFAYHHMNTYEDSVIEIYATQQDELVQFVLEKIHQSNNKINETTIINTLNQLNSSHYKYWTLSDDNSLIFIKNDTETNRYKGLTPATYYNSESAQSFLRDLKVNKVTHRIIQLENRDFVASGVIFQYEGTNYQICLLMNSNSVLDQNAYLDAKINLLAMLFVVFLVFILFSILFTSYNIQKQNELNQKSQECIELRKTIHRLHNDYTEHQLYDTRQNLFMPEVLPLFLEKLDKRNIHPITLVTIQANQEADLQVFLKESQLLLDQSVFRFSKAPLQVLLIFLQYNSTDALTKLDPLITPNIQIMSCKELGQDDIQSFIQVLNKKGETETTHGK